MDLPKHALAVPLALILVVDACTGSDPDEINDPAKDGGTPEAAMDGGSNALPDADPQEAGPSAPRCDPTKPFGTPVLVKGKDLNTSGNESYPTLTADETTL